MEEKIKIIDEITKRHPSWGIGRGWSHYTGGMKDAGGWYVRKMLDASEEDLRLFLEDIITEENKPSQSYTEEESGDMKIIRALPDGGFTAFPILAAYGV